MKYDGTSDITLFLRRFDGLRTRILALDPDHYDDFLMEATLSLCLQDAKPSPSVGVDGERYIGPATWYEKQPIDDVDTYDKLKRKLEAKFKAKVESMSKIFSRLAQLERGDKTVKDFAYEFDDTRGTTEIPDFNLIDIFTKQMPREVTKRLLISCPDFRERTYEEVKNLCVKLDHAVRNPDPLEIGLKKLSKLRIGEDRQHHVARLERQLAESQEQLNHLLRLQGAERWTLRAAPERRILTRKTDPREFEKYFGSNFPGEAENLEPGRLTEEGDQPRRRTGPEILESDSESESEEQRPAAHLLCIKPERQLFSSAVRPPPVQQDAEATLQEMVPRRPEDLVEKELPRRNPVPSLERSAPDTADERQASDSRADENTNLTENAISRVLVRILTMRDFEDRRILTMRTNYTKETEEFAQSSGTRESSNDGQHVQLPARLAASKVFIVKRFKRCHLDVKPFLPTLDDTLLENFRTEDIKLGLSPGPEPPPCTTMADSEELYPVDVDITVKTSAGSRDDRSLHISTPNGHSAVTIHCKMVEVNGKHVVSEYKITRLGPGPEPPPASDVWSLGFADVKLTFLMVYIRRTFKFVFRTQGAHSRGQQHSLMSYYVDYPGFLERPARAGKNLKYCHYNYLDGQLYKHKWAIRKGFTQWLEVKLSLRPIGEMGIERIVASARQTGGRRARTYTGEAELPGVMDSHFYHLKYGETIDAVDIEETKFAAPGSDTRKLKELDGDDRDTGGGDTAKLTEPGGAHVEVVTAGVAKSQGKAERSIKDVKGTMRKVMMDEEGKKDWVSILPQAQFAYNTRVPYGTYGLTPSVLLFGYTLRAPILNLVAPVPSLLELEGTLKVAKELHRLREIRLQGVREEAVDRNLEYWRERSLKHDAGLRRHTYQVGDLVLVQNYALANGFGRPWDRRWKGPFKITRISRSPEGKSRSG
jgi:hypothetical protein